MSDLQTTDFQLLIKTTENWLVLSNIFTSFTPLRYPLGNDFKSTHIGHKKRGWNKDEEGKDGEHWKKAWKMEKNTVGRAGNGKKFVFLHAK